MSTIRSIPLTVASGDGNVTLSSGAVVPKARRRLPPVVTKKIAIVGKAPSSRMQAPYGDESWEIWTIADMFRIVPRWTRYFELHEVESRREKWGDYFDFLKTDHGKVKTVYVREPHPELPHAAVYPKEQVVAAFSLTETAGNDRRRLAYFTNQVSWMVALAILEGATDIGLWGVDMAQHGDGVKSEYAYQRPSCEYFLGIAAGRGIRTTVHEASDLLKARLLYGFDPDTNAMRLKWKARHDELAKELGDINANLQQCIGRQNILQGHLDEMTHWPKGKKRIEREKEFRAKQAELNGGIDMLVKRQHVLMGALDDMQYWREWSE